MLGGTPSATNVAITTRALVTDNVASGVCGKEGHIQRNCPQLKRSGNGNGSGSSNGNNQGNNGNNPNQNNNNGNNGNNADNGGNGAKGRAFVLGSGEARYDHNVVTGKFLLNNYFASVLFDTGADRSFISKKLSDMIKGTPTLLEANHILDIDLMPVTLGSFDVIVGMD
ncbi:hypothetical protein L1987_84306 [Smallanthus sonchifolius]|uniref:Uncharacterized protein n=1 Tax=Smallanthus sonchifolius TaxID=185202 RepID=A0ACB8YEF9_9ASTR|nr:hypothetical protein L1987_84306 [Smallanthus sonchifolius]